MLHPSGTARLNLFIVNLLGMGTAVFVTVGVFLVVDLFVTVGERVSVMVGVGVRDCVAIRVTTTIFSLITSIAGGLQEEVIIASSSEKMILCTLFTTFTVCIIASTIHASPIY